MDNLITMLGLGYYFSDDEKGWYSLCIEKDYEYMIWEFYNEY